MKTIADHDAIRQMREFNKTHPGTRWFAYENKDLSHQMMGHVQFLATGPNCTYDQPPHQYPDTQHGLGWRYQLLGEVNVSRNTLGDET